MKFYGVFTICLSIATLSSGFLNYNCYSSNQKPCEIFFTPNDPKFIKEFLPTLDALTQISIQFGITGYENDPKTILGQVNEDLKEVNQTTIQNFVKKLSGVKYKNPTYIELIADENPFFLPDHLNSNNLKTLGGRGNLLSGFNYGGR